MHTHSLHNLLHFSINNDPLSTEKGLLVHIPVENNENTHIYLKTHLINKKVLFMTFF